MAPREGNIPPALRRARWFVKRHGTVHRPGDRPPVVVASLPRSGSTWLMEIIATQPGMRVVNEPFYLPRFVGLADPPLPPAWSTLTPGPGREARLGPYLDALFDNRLGIGSPSPFTPQHRFRTSRVVCKVLRAHDLLPWIEARYDARIVVLVRHPIAVAVSRRAHPLLGVLLDSDEWCARHLDGDERARARDVAAHGGPLERMVLDWCLQLRPVLRAERRTWFCVHYEDLLVHPDAAIDALADALGLDDREAMHRQNGVPSRSTFLSDDETRRRLEAGDEREFLLAKWRSRVDDAQERGLLELAASFGVDLYAPGRGAPVRRLGPGWAPADDRAPTGTRS